MQSQPMTDTPRARATDPATSHQAAEKIRRNGQLGKQQKQVLQAVRQWPGRTSAELAENGRRYAADTGRPRYLTERHGVAKRLPELEPVHVRRGEPRRCKLTGNMATTWWPKHLGASA